MYEDAIKNNRTFVSYCLNPSQYGFVSGSVLKLVAVITMMVDHIGAGVLYPLYLDEIFLFGLSKQEFYYLYRVTRSVGRIAFPIFCFLLVEAFYYTSNRYRYLVSLLVFGLFSEFSFDLALMCVAPGTAHRFVSDAFLGNKTVVFESQNIFFTLSIGFICIWSMHYIRDLAKKCVGIMRERSAASRRVVTEYIINLLSVVVSILVVVVACLIADTLCADYKHRGVLTVVILYVLRRFRIPALLCSYFYLGNLAYSGGRINLLVWSSGVWAFPGYILMLLYNGERGFVKGKTIKYAFYAFYPVHLFLIWMARIIIYRVI